MVFIKQTCMVDHFMTQLAREQDGVRGADPHIVENLHVTFDSPKNLATYTHCWVEALMII